MAWTFTKKDGAQWEAHDGERLRAVIYRDNKLYTVHAVGTRLDGTRFVRPGCDTFKTLKGAKNFISNYPGKWGK